MYNSIFLSKIDVSLSNDTYNDLLKIISEENRERCRRFKFKEDSLRTLYGELILRHVLNKQFSIKNEDVEILKGNAGKPYVKGFPIYFNISHAGDYVVCAFSEQEVGIDIEQVKQVDLDIAKRYFCQSECEDLFAKEASHRLEYFFSLWTLKESYMKWLGDGMSIALDSFFFKIKDEDISVVDVNRKTSPFFKQLTIDDYKLSICSMIKDFPTKIEKISIEKG